MQDGTDAVPQTVLTPALIAAVGGMPRAVGRRHLTPWNPGVHDPEQALEETLVVQGWAATGRLLRRQEWRDLPPEGVAQGRGPGKHGGQRRVSGSQQRLARGAPRNMALTGTGLVAPPPVRPLEPRAPPGVLGLAQEEQQTPHFGDGQRDAFVVAERSPPFPSWAWPWRALRRVISRAAWASRARVV